MANYTMIYGHWCEYLDEHKNALVCPHMITVGRLATDAIKALRHPDDYPNYRAYMEAVEACRVAWGDQYPAWPKSEALDAISS